MSDKTELAFLATTASGESCCFGEKASAQAWAGVGGEVKDVPLVLRDFKLLDGRGNGESDIKAEQSNSAGSAREGGNTKPVLYVRQFDLDVITNGRAIVCSATADEAWNVPLCLAAPVAERAAAPASVPEGDADELHFNAQRLRNVAALVGLASAVPQDDATLDGARGAVLGQIAAKLRKFAAPEVALPADSVVAHERKAP